MRPAPLTGNAITGTRDHPGAAGTRAPAPVTSGRDPRKARALLPRPGGLLRRVAGLLRRVPKTNGSYHDPLFERPDLVEDDYHRFRNQPYGGSQPDARW
jgi:hypothetical protein